MSALERQIRESIAIETFPCKNILNGKGEWGTNLIPRARFDEPESSCLNQNQNFGQNQNWKTRLNRNHNIQPDLRQKPDARPDQKMSSSSFENQLFQRKKRRRLEQEQENQMEPESQNQISGRPEPETRTTLPPCRRMVQARRTRKVNQKDRMVQRSWNHIDIRQAFAKAGQLKPNIVSNINTEDWPPIWLPDTIIE